MLAENYHQRDRRDAMNSWMLVECGKTLCSDSDLETETGENLIIRTFKDISSAMVK